MVTSTVDIVAPRSLIIPTDNGSASSVATQNISGQIILSGTLLLYWNGTIWSIITSS